MSHTCTLPEAAAWIANATGGPRPHTATLTRWINRGVRGRRLPAKRAGGGRFVVDVRDLAKFVEVRNAEQSNDMTAGVHAGQLELEGEQLAALLGRTAERSIETPANHRPLSASSA
jgi:hypothetical protein